MPEVVTNSLQTAPTIKQYSKVKPTAQSKNVLVQRVLDKSLTNFQNNNLPAAS